MEFQSSDVGRQFGLQGVEQMVSNAEGYSQCEEQRIALTNQPRIMAVRAELALFLEKEAALKEKLRQAPPAGDVRSRQRKAVYYWAVTIVLTIAGFFFSLLAFEPFRLGWKSYLYCTGIAVVTPFCVEKFLESWGKEKLIRILATVAFISAITSLMLLAVIRGDLLMREVKDTTAAVVIEDEGTPTPPQPENSFYDETLAWFRLTLILLALSMELAAGLALYDARRWGAESGEDWRNLSSELDAAHVQMVGLLHELTSLENEPAVFVASFWREFYHSMLTHAARSALTKLVIVMLGVLIVLPHRAEAAERLNLVIAVDLTQSVAVKGHDGKTELQKNIEAVSQLLGEIPAGSHVTVLGITDNSFAQPYLLLSADIGDDEGYFKERLDSARRQLVAAWHKRSAHVEQRFQQTDVFGALLLASQIFRQSGQGRKNVLVVFSDMRENSPGFNLEAKHLPDPSITLATLKQRGLIADLQDVEVFALGVDNAGMDIGHWNLLCAFWSVYFAEAGARLQTYTVLRDAVRLDRSTSELR